MEVKTVNGIMDIHIGTKFAQVYGPVQLGLVVIWEVIGEPKVEVCKSGTRLISWLARDTKKEKKKNLP